MPSSLFLNIINRRELGITIFKISYLVIFLYTLIGTWSIYQVNDQSIFFFTTAKTLGQVSLILFVLTLIPGIFRRFRKQNEIVAVLMIFRRYIGILMYILVATHSWHLIGIDILKGFLPFPLQPYLLSGIVAYTMLFLLAITSNDLSTKKLGIWWHRIHNLSYTLLWFIFLHTVLQEISIWSILIGFVGIVLIISHLYSKFKK